MSATPEAPGTGAWVVVSCEHGGRRVPSRYRHLFTGAEAILDSHRGWDPGALLLARELARSLEAPLVASTTSRLVVELNRSRHHRQWLSEFTRALSPGERQRLWERHYRPHRERVEELVAVGHEEERSVLHLGVHTFTPVLSGRDRRTDVGLLYDPGRRDEALFARRLRDALRRRLPELSIRLNHPYRGHTDGLTTTLRRRFPDRYLGIELEVSQAFPAGSARRWRRLRAELAAALLEVTAGAEAEDGG